MLLLAASYINLYKIYNYSYNIQVFLVQKLFKKHANICKAQPRRTLLGYPFHNTTAHTEAMSTREGI